MQGRDEFENGTMRFAVSLNRRQSLEVSDKSIHITDAVKRAVEEHALRERPAECCGLLSGANGIITDIHPLRNEAERPETRYLASPADLFAAMRIMRDAGKRLLGIYHSHPRSSAFPSSSDVEMAFYPEAVYFIISLEPRIEMRAFRIEGAGIEEVTVSVIEESLM